MTLRPLIPLLAAMPLLFADPPTDTDDPLLAGCEAAAAYSRAHGGHAFLVRRAGEVVFERYFEGWTADRPHFLASGTKSFSGALAAAAVEDGLIRWDERLSDTISEWKDDPRKSRITVRQLLSLTGGLDPGKIARVPTGAEAIGAEALHDPGTVFAYGPVPFQAFGEFMTRKLLPRKETPLGYLRRRIFHPIGLVTGDWNHDADGNAQLPSGASVTARDWSRFGELILNRGKSGKRQVVAWDALSECFRPGQVNPDYGLTFWLGVESKRGGSQTPLPEGFCMAAGAGNQRLYILPSHGLVVVHFARLSLRFDDRELLRLLLENLPAPATPRPPR
ncbi:MAG: serine hydrolase [Candidatus Brocadiae bacterium]|nr:serine hydrolase [Candidatus Brocadiia bacterium]